ncbi:hypothetical protein JNW90_19890 [Micromonospora sp. STR1s_5]|nr:hypothetical protein [Micromonospora sp. STR1s_5]
MTRKLRRPARPAVLPHPFVQQDGVPPDPWSRLAPCQKCHKLGKPGDAQHPDAATAETPPAVAAALDLEARILGERE